jgi:hypothetical protein
VFWDFCAGRTNTRKHERGEQTGGGIGVKNKQKERKEEKEIKYYTLRCQAHNLAAGTRLDGTVPLVILVSVIISKLQ